MEKYLNKNSSSILNPYSLSNDCNSLEKKFNNNFKVKRRKIIVYSFKYIYFNNHKSIEVKKYWNLSFEILFKWKKILFKMLFFVSYPLYFLSDFIRISLIFRIIILNDNILIDIIPFMFSSSPFSSFVPPSNSESHRLI